MSLLLMAKWYTSVQKVHTVKLNTDVTITILPIQQHKSTLKYHQLPKTYYQTMDLQLLQLQLQPQLQLRLQLQLLQ